MKDLENQELSIELEISKRECDTRTMQVQKMTEMLHGKTTTPNAGKNLSLDLSSSGLASSPGNSPPLFTPALSNDQNNNNSRLKVPDLTDVPSYQNIDNNSNNNGYNNNNNSSSSSNNYNVNGNVPLSLDQLRESNIDTNDIMNSQNANSNNVAVYNTTQNRRVTSNTAV